ncbi:MAG TPA: hypothetical protein VL136_07660 [Candidatus Babeliales bacterium]|jgi:hypothetical protein|nr:hypothetical protein [Candidatus Babeliales bacterium]
MDEFSYLSVLISVILGLALTQILKGFRGILLSRTRVRIYWPVLAWAVLLLLVCVQSWWAMFELRHYQPWTFAAFAIVLLQTIVTYMLAGLIFPDLFGEGIVDLRESFYAHRVWFFAFGFLVILVSISKGVVLYGELPHRTDLVFHAFFATIFLIGAFTGSESCHKALVVLAMATFILYIIIVFARLH